MIRSAAECILKVFGRFEKCFRIGGDEFVAIVSVEKEKIGELYQALREEVSRREGLSLSAGYAMAAEHPDCTIEELVNLADKMMYEDKNAHYRTMSRDSQREAAEMLPTKEEGA